MLAIRQKVPVKYRKRLKIWRARIAEGLGFKRYSYPALNNLDRKMDELLPDSGVFLEIGANDGYTQSNTYFLERLRNWDGILIEPVPWLYELCTKTRPRSRCYNFACTAPRLTGQPIEMLDLDLTSVSLGQQAHDSEARRTLATGRIVSVESATLSSLIDRSGFTHIDYMSVDVEGAELTMLTGLDLERHTPTWLLVETANSAEVEDRLAPYMKLYAQLSHHDYLFYCSRSLSEVSRKVERVRHEK